MHTWQVQEAKAKFSELLRSASKDGPQAISIRGRTTAVVLSEDDYKRLKGRKSPLVQFLSESPLAGVELQIVRDASLPREVEL
jgi:antitoxin Phd